MENPKMIEILEQWESSLQERRDTLYNSLRHFNTLILISEIDDKIQRIRKLINLKRKETKTCSNVP